MKNNRLAWPVCLLLTIFFMASCAGNLELRKEQAEATRKLGEAYFQQGNYSYALRELKEEVLIPNFS